MNKKHLICLSVAGLLPAFSASADPVQVGSSTLINTVERSDTFTIGTGSSGTRNDDVYNTGSYPMSPQVALLESAYASNPSTTIGWREGAFSINNDAIFVNHGSPYTVAWQGSGGGSATGMVQQGGQTIGQNSAGVSYNLGDNYVVQIDATRGYDNVATDGTTPVADVYGFIIHTGSAPLFENNTAADGLSVFFNTDGSIDLFNTNVGRISTGFTSVLPDFWNNYAVNFNTAAETVSIYTNQNFLGTLDLNTFNGGSFANVVGAGTNDIVGFGADRIVGDAVTVLHADNFQTGTAIPEPGALGLLSGGVAFLFVMGRRRRVSCKS